MALTGAARARPARRAKFAALALRSSRFCELARDEACARGHRLTRPRASREFPRVPSSRSDHHGALRAVLGSARPSARLGRRLVSLPASSSRILKIYVTPDGAPSPPLPVASRAPQADNRHTIVLVQPTKSKASRTFLDYEKISLAMDGARPTARAPIPAASPRAGTLSPEERSSSRLPVPARSPRSPSPPVRRFLRSQACARCSRSA